MVFAEATALMTNIKAAMDIANVLKSSYDTHTITKAQSEILDRLLAVHANAAILYEKYSAVCNENEGLTKKLMEFEQWKETESEYELKEIVRGTRVYSLKKNQQSTELSHWLCPNCWNDRKKYILQAEFDNGEEAKYYCPKCRFSFHFYHKQPL